MEDDRKDASGSDDDGSVLVRELFGRLCGPNMGFGRISRLEITGCTGPYVDGEDTVVRLFGRLETPPPNLSVRVISDGVEIAKEGDNAKFLTIRYR
jgi:hypothetical protein